MKTSGIYFCLQFLATCTLQLFSSQADNTLSGCTQQNLELTCRNLNLYSAPTISDSRLLEKLDISYNTVKLLAPNFFDGYDNLRILVIRNTNMLRIDPGAFNSLKNLTFVDLSYNSFTSVPSELFTENPKLQKVSLSNNPLTMQPLDLPILNSSSLLYLDLSNCKLSELSTTSLSQVPNVLSLDISENRLKVLSTGTLLPITRLNKIDLRKNPWICSHKFEALLYYAMCELNSEPNRVKCLANKGSKKVTITYTTQKLRELCTRLATNSKSLKSNTTTPTAPIDVATDMKTLGPVTGSPNQTPKSAFFSNFSSTPSTDSTIRENMTPAKKENSQEFIKTEKPEDTSENTKNPEEDINSSGKIKSFPTDINHVVLVILPPLAGAAAAVAAGAAAMFLLCRRWNILNRLRQYVTLPN